MAFLFRQSFGRFVVLETARRDSRLQKLAVYEFDMSIDGSINMNWAIVCEEEWDHEIYRDVFIDVIPVTSKVSDSLFNRTISSGLGLYPTYYTVIMNLKSQAMNCSLCS